VPADATSIPPPSRARIIGAVTLGWIATLGADFLLHAGLLARLYVEPHPFLLAPRQAFQRIPLGYLSFLLLAILVGWLIVRLRRLGFARGAGLGLQVGGLAWGAFALGLLSVSSADPALLGGWFVGQTLEMALAGGVIGAALSTERLRLVVASVIGLVVLCFLLTVALQIAGLAPAVHAGPP
jgi:hypothetical protein